MKKIILSITAISVASLLFVLSGCELSFNTAETTNGHTAIVEITDESGNIIGTEAVSVPDNVLEEGKNFFQKFDDSTTAPGGVSSDRIQQGLNNGGTASTTAAAQTTTAGGNTNSTQKPDNTTIVADDGKILKSNQYMIIGRVESPDGTSVPYKIARNGEKLAMYSVFNGTNIGIIILEDKVYMLSADEKVYLEISKELIKENTTDEDMLEMFSGSALDRDVKVAKKTTAAEDGVVYDVVVYETGDKDYFLGGTIIKTVATDGGVLYYDSVSAVAPASVFAPPADYTRQTLNEENVSDFAGMVDASLPHEHE